MVYMGANTLNARGGRKDNPRSAQRQQRAPATSKQHNPRHARHGENKTKRLSGPSVETGVSCGSHPHSVLPEHNNPPGGGEQSPPAPSATANRDTLRWRLGRGPKTTDPPAPSATANRDTLRWRLGRGPKPTDPPGPSATANRDTLRWRLGTRWCKTGAGP